MQTPVGAEVIDPGDATLSPGFIDAHTHLSFMYHPDYRDDIGRSVRKPIPEQALFAAENLKKTLMAGVTSVRDVGSRISWTLACEIAAAAGMRSGSANARIGSLHQLHRRSLRRAERDARGIFGYESGPEHGVINGPDEGRKRGSLQHQATVPT